MAHFLLASCPCALFTCGENTLRGTNILPQEGIDFMSMDDTIIRDSPHAPRTSPPSKEVGEAVSHMRR
jgi:hypothetical protein